ncbi:MAG TPA: NrfD/PsrC family molybdoenzyme membrane anchor subunit [Candidatus Methanoperedens sp.]
MKLEKPIFWLAIAGLVIGAYGMFVKAAQGNLAANIGSFIPWGLGVAAYAYLMGLSAGSFLLSAAAYAFKIKSLENLKKPGLIIAFSTAIPGMLLVFADIGHPFRIFTSALHLNTGSIVGWLFLLYPIYLVILIAMLWLTSDEKRSVKTLAIAGIIVAVAFELAGGALYGVIGARTYWNPFLLPLMFLAAALLSGFALVAFASYILCSDREGTIENVRSLGNVILLLIALYTLLEILDIASIYYSGVPADINSINLVLFGSFAWVFWGFFVLGNVLIPAGLLAFKRNAVWSVPLASFFIGISSLSTKLNTVIPGLAVPEMTGLETAFVHQRLSFSYFPSTMEWLEFIFALSLAAFLIIIGNRMLVERKTVSSLLKEMI